MPQAQDPKVLIGELVKALNLYSNLGARNHSNVNKNSNARGASKKFWMQKIQSNLVFLIWSLCCFTLFFMTIVLCWFLFSLFLGFALHNIYEFHSRSFCYFLKKKRSKMCFALFFLDLKSRLANLFLHNMFMYFVQLG